MGQGLVMEDEMVLDGAITSAQFDHTMDVGVVATAEGTLWYVNWVERTSISTGGLTHLKSKHAVNTPTICFPTYERCSFRDDGQAYGDYINCELVVIT